MIDRLVSDDPDTQQRSRAAQYLDILIDSGLVDFCRPYADQSRDATGELCAWLEKNNPDHRLLPTLRALRESLDAYPHRAPSDRSTWYREAAPPTTGQAGDGRRILHENALLHDRVVTLPRGPLQSVCADLGTVHDVFALFDASLPAKIATADLFRTLHGDDESVPFLRFYRELHDPAILDHHPAVRRFLRQYLGPSAEQEPGPKKDAIGPRLAGLRELRKETWNWLNAFGQRFIPPSAVDERMAAWPAYVSTGAAVSCYGQLVEGPQGPMFVSNMMLTRPRRGIGRIQHLLGSTSATQDDDSELAEFRTGGNSNINLRPRALRTIDYPYVTHESEPDHRLADLQVGYDHTSGLLHLRGCDGSVVRPVHGGLLSRAFLPPAQSLMIWVFGANPRVMSTGWSMGERRSSSLSDKVTHSPRLTIGSVVVARARWRMPASNFPQPDAGEQDAAYLPRLAHWLSDHDIPRRFFARVVSMEDLRQGKAGNDHKPVFTDVTNWFLLKSLIRSLPYPDKTLILEETLPEVSDAPHYGTYGQHVTEYILDLPRRPA